jgi:hypothetical protein
MKAFSIIAVASLFMLSGCGDPPPMDWSRYHPSVKQRIDQLAADRDCADLQREHDIAYQNDDAQRERTGSGNGDLMNYIHEQLEAAGCY